MPVDDDDDLKFDRASLDRFKQLCLQLCTRQSTSSGQEHKVDDDQARLDALCAILDEYQDQAFLLDKDLTELVAPVVACLPHSHDTAVLDNSQTRQLFALLYHLTKVRGHKVISQFLPHEATDLLALVNIFKKSDLAALTWQTRFGLLLWLSVAVRVPFSLTTATVDDAFVTSIADAYLGASGKERDGAIALLTAYYTRQDANLEQLVQACEHALNTSASTQDAARAASYLAALVDALQSVKADKVLPHWPRLYNMIATSRDLLVSARVQSHKLWIKLTGRLGLLALVAQHGHHDVPPEVEVILQDLLEALAAADTVVRWSAAKYIARISVAVPKEMAEEIAEAVMGCLDTSLRSLDRPERGSQGACFALGELGRRSQLSAAVIETALPLILEALVLDHKRGMQSVGSGLRDAAAYVIWAISRTTPATALSPKSLDKLAQTLVCVACFDREVQVRRAASAAFQECAGRWQDHLPNGIDTLRKIDFITVGVQSRAFLEAAPAVAVHVSYRMAIIEFLLSRSLSHYDPEIRALAAGCLGRLATLDVDELGPELVDEMVPLQTKDSSRLHGQLLALASLSAVLKQLPAAEPKVKAVFSSVCELASVSRVHRSSPLLVATLQTLQNSCTAASLAQYSSWRSLVDKAKATTDSGVHQAAADFWAVASRVCACEKDVTSFLDDLQSKQPARQRLAALCLGSIHAETNLQLRVFDELASFVQDKSPKPWRLIESRRDALKSLADISVKHIIDLDAARLEQAFAIIQSGLRDYTSDQRGDVGSWVRIAALDALPNLVVTASYHDRLNQDELDFVVAGALKQAVEPLDNVREAAVRCLATVARNVTDGLDVRLAGRSCLQELSLSREWARSQRLVSDHLLALMIERKYSLALLEGTVLATAHHTGTSPLFDFVTSLPCGQEDVVAGQYTLLAFVTDLTTLLRKNVSSNRFFVNAASLVDSLFEGGAMSMLNEEDTAVRASLMKLLDALSVGVHKIKSELRLKAVASAAIAMTSVICTRRRALGIVRAMLSHSSLNVREHCFDELSSHLVTLCSPDEIERVDGSLALHADVVSDGKDASALMAEIERLLG
ncbi:hypothetical protein ACM66B_003278 [Microbotryomycetes sp. NB124-2]